MAALRALIIFAVFIGVVCFVASTGRGGSVMAGIFIVVGIPMLIATLRDGLRKDDR
jgi:hypothetical protein